MDGLSFKNCCLTLATVAIKYNASVTNVALRWILGQDYVGAVIVGTRMGIWEHTEENLKTFVFKLDDDNKEGTRLQLRI